MNDEIPVPTPALGPVVEVTQEHLNKWYQKVVALQKLKEEELALRLFIAKGKFPEPKEGTNKTPLTDGYYLEMQHTITRKILEDVYTTALPALRKSALPIDSLVKVKHEISVTEYRKLSDEGRAMIDACMEVKPGSPQLKITKPKRG